MFFTPPNLSVFFFPRKLSPMKSAFSSIFLCFFAAAAALGSGNLKTVPQQFFPFSLKFFPVSKLFFTICADNFYYKLCNACYKLANTYYKLCNTCYKVCNKNCIIG